MIPCAELNARGRLALPQIGRSPAASRDRDRRSPAAPSGTPALVEFDQVADQTRTVGRGHWLRGHPRRVHQPSGTGRRPERSILARLVPHEHRLNRTNRTANVARYVTAMVVRLPVHLGCLITKQPAQKPVVAVNERKVDGVSGAERLAAAVVLPASDPHPHHEKSLPVDASTC